MKRYFDVPDQKLVVWFEMKDGSLACFAGVEVFERQFQCKMKEITEEEYKRLKKEYSNATIQ